jgi:tetratricopeptide (TPR) repeat protein
MDEDDIFRIQDEIALSVLEGLKIRLLGKEKEQIVKRGTESTEAYHLYLRGLYHAETGVEEGAERALDYFQRAIDIDPNYALAHAGIALAYLQQIPYVLSPEEGGRKVKAAVTKALDIDDTFAEIHCVKGMMHTWLDWDWSSAQKEFKRAVELEPNYARAHHLYSLFLAMLGRNEEAIEEIRRALELDPLSIIINNDVAWNYHYARDYDRAVEFYKKTLDLNPGFPMALRELGTVYAMKGLFEEAVSTLEKATDISSGDRTRARLARVYAMASREAEARTILDDLLAQSNKRHVSPCLIAEIYVGLGENDEAFKWLDKAYLERDSLLSVLKAAPKWDPLRPDPRFKELLKKMNFGEV